MAHLKTPLHNGLGAVLAMHDRQEEAIEQFLSAIKLDPKLAEAHFNLGLTL